MSTLNLAKMTVTGTPGVGTLTLGVAVGPYQSFASAQAQDGASYSYVIQEGTKFECGHGVYTVSGTTLSRVTVYDSSAGYGVKETFTTAATVFSSALSKDTVTVGRQSLFIPAGAMIARTTNGPVQGQLETTTNKVNQLYWSFDPNTLQYVQFSLRMPKSWDLGTITYQPVWIHPATTTNFGVAWDLQAVAVRTNVALDVAYGTAIQVNSTGGTTSNLYLGNESSAMTVAGSLAAQDYVNFQLYRNASDATNDTLAVNAYLVGLNLFINTAAENDA